MDQNDKPNRLTRKLIDALKYQLCQLNTPSYVEELSRVYCREANQLPRDRKTSPSGLYKSPVGRYDGGVDVPNSPSAAIPRFGPTVDWIKLPRAVGASTPSAHRP